MSQSVRWATRQPTHFIIPELLVSCSFLILFQSNINIYRRQALARLLYICLRIRYVKLKVKHIEHPYSFSSSQPLGRILLQQAAYERLCRFRNSIPIRTSHRVSRLHYGTQHHDLATMIERRRASQQNRKENAARPKIRWFCVAGT